SIVSLAGTGGIGKSALACHFATQYKEHFTDGVIGLRVDGKDVETIARDFAREMGVIFEEEDEQALDAATIMQELFASRRMLLIFDNADEASIKKLRPSGNVCAIIVTTRDRSLSFFLDIPNEGTIDLSPLIEQDSLLLLQRILGEQRINRELDAAREIIKYLGNLPLALQITGGHLQGTKRSVGDYLEQLKEEILELMSQDHDDFNLIASLRLSLDLLTEEEIDFFACLSVCAEDGFSRKTAMIAGEIENRWKAQKYLDRFHQLSLINYTEEGENRFVFHPLVQDFSQNLLEQRGLREIAERRHAKYFIDWIGSNAENLSVIASQISEDIDDLILVGEWLRNNKIANYNFIESLHEFFEEYGYWKKAAELMKDFQEFATQSKDWEFVVIFCTRRARYLSLQEKFEDAKVVLQIIPEILTNIESEMVRKRSHVKWLVRLGRILEQQEYFDEAIDNLQLAVSIARYIDDTESLRNALNVLGWVFKRKGQIDNAIEIFQEEIKLNKTINDQQGIAIALNRMGGLLQQQGRIEEAIAAFQREIEVSEAINDQKQIAIALNRMGGLLQQQGRIEEAIAAFQRQIEVSEAINEQKSVAIALNCMGGLLQQQGRFEEAISAFQRQIEVSEAINEHQSVAIALNRMGGLLQQQGRIEEAISAFQRQIDVSEAINDRKGMEIELHKLGNLLKGQQKFAEAEKTFRQSYDIAVQLEDRRGQALILNSLGQVLSKQGGQENINLALINFRESIKLGQELNNLEHLAKVHTAMGEALFAYQNDKQAAIALIKGFEIEENSKNTRGLEIVIKPLMYVLVKLNRKEEAKEYCQRALTIVPNNKNILELEKQLSSGIFLKQGKVTTIKHNQKDTMYGWITPSDRSNSIYFHEHFINSDCISQLKIGTRVEVFIKESQKGWVATYMRILDDAIKINKS
ncbi:tetratricopeptide repeat protein, partial [Spirulina sp. 06S082]|uniref:tetratricopeptide repeat protein n=1 Tax=Spirulina sp. 06S082 TaxID=3110248 RepID=UPI002B215A33